MVYGETGMYPISLDIQARVISFWTKLLEDNDNRAKKLSSFMYDIVYSLNEQNKCKSKWLENVKELIQKNGYGNIWLRQQEINKKWFILSFKQKIRDQYLQTWESLLDKSTSSINYRIFKNRFEINNYFTHLSNYHVRILTAFRTRNHRLPIEVGRWHGKAVNERVCQLCNAEIGDEYHYVLKCENFKEQRKTFIKQYYIRYPNTLKFNELMNTRNHKELENLCKFITIIRKNVNII